MSQRLRYEKTADPFVIRSKSLHTADGKYVYVSLHKTALTFDICDANTNAVLEHVEGLTKSYVVLLRKVKEKLEAMGVAFQKENRKDYVKTEA
jgi:hypothetical protein